MAKRKKKTKLSGVNLWPSYQIRHYKRAARYSVGELKQTFLGKLDIAEMFRQARLNCKRMHNLYQS